MQYHITRENLTTLIRFRVSDILRLNDDEFFAELRSLVNAYEQRDVSLPYGIYLHHDRTMHSRPRLFSQAGSLPFDRDQMAAEVG